VRSNRPTIADPEVRFQVFRNVSSAALARGTPVFFATVGDSGAGVAPNGISVHLCPSSGRVVSLFAGIVLPDLGIAAGDYGECQVRGWCDFALVSQDAGNVINIGEFLQGSVGNAYLVRQAAVAFTRVVLMETIQIGAAVAGRKVLLFGGA
jgi:hypothetical protein